MSVSKVLLTLCIAAIPCWYLYRTLTEREVTHFDLQEMFMTPRERRERAKEAEKAAEERTAAEVERQAKAQVRASRMQRCSDWAADAERARQELVVETKRYESGISELRKLPVPQGSLYDYQFARTFNLLYIESQATSSSEIGNGKRQCEGVAEREDDFFPHSQEVSSLEGMAQSYQGSIRRLKQSYEQIVDLIDYAGNRLPQTIDGELRRARVRENVSRADKR